MGTQRDSDQEAGRPERHVPVDMGALVFALDDHGGEHAWYLDLESGEVWLVSDDVVDEDLPLPREELEESPRFLLIEPAESHESWQVMADFVDTVRGPALRTRLADAIEGKGAFRRFKDVLLSYPEERDRWFAFETERADARARAWLAENGIV